MPNNPFVGVGQKVDLVDVRNAISDIRGDEMRVLELLEKHDRTQSNDDYMQLVLAMSGLEIKYTNFGDAMRKKFLS